MTTDHARTLDGIKLAAAVMVGGMVLAGWAFDIAVLKNISPGWASMKPNAAACFILIGVALLLIAIPPATLILRHSFACSVLRSFLLCRLIAVPWIVAPGYPLPKS